MSLLACRFGARRVYAVETSGAAEILVQSARDNGYADRIVVLQERSTEVTLPERADVIVSHARGVLPAHGTHLADILDARRRMLAPRGRLIPQTETVWLAVSSAPDVEESRRPWEGAPLGLDLRSALPFVENSVFRYSATADQLLSRPAQWARLDYPAFNELHLRESRLFTIARRGTAHGLLAWFDAELVEGVGYSNAPGAREGSYHQLLFPWPRPIALDEGDMVNFELRADPVGAGILWTWTTEIRLSRDSNAVPERMRHTTFRSKPISLKSLRKRALDFVPERSAEGELALFILGRMNASCKVGDIAAQLQEAYPARFQSFDDAHGVVAEFCERYSAA